MAAWQTLSHILSQDPHDLELHSSHFTDVNSETGVCYMLSGTVPSLTSLISQGRKESAKSPNDQVACIVL